MQVTSNQTSNVLPTKPTIQFEQSQYNCLKFSNLSVPSQISSLDIQITPSVYLHQVRCGHPNNPNPNNNKPHIVLLHGYGGTSLTFIRLFKPLSEKYIVHALDMLGVGLSSRVKFNEESTAQQAIDYHIDAVENWRKAVGLKTFTLAGHSFGGYLAAMYARKYPYAVDRLVLISPPGVGFMDGRMSQEAVEKIEQRASFGRKIVYTVAKKLIQRQTTPSEALSCKLLGSLVLNHALSSRLGLSGQQLSHWKSFYKAICSLTPTSQRSFHKIFYLPTLGCEHPISHMLSQGKYPFPIEFYYGDSDWMERCSARELAVRRAGGNDIGYRIVEGAGHQIIFENPEGMVGYILGQGV